MPCASLSATSGAAIPAVMSPKPAGRVNSAGRSPAAADDHQPARWHFRLDGADYLAESDGHRWSLTTKAPTARADVTITAAAQALAAFIFAGAEADIDITRRDRASPAIPATDRHHGHRRTPRLGQGTWARAGPRAR